MTKQKKVLPRFFSERELTSVCLSSVCNVRAPIQAIEIFGNIFISYER